MQTYFRSNRTLVKFEGPQAQKLLNDVITGTVSKNPDTASWWALLSPQGKIQAEGLIGWFGGAYYLDVPLQAKDNFLRRMNMFRLRAKADITDLGDSHRIGWSAGRPAPKKGVIVHADGRGPHCRQQTGFRLIASTKDTHDWLEDGKKHALERVKKGIMELGEDFSADSLFPHDIAMDLLGGVDFDKGCYVGQEVVSRMHHRGAARKRPVLVEFSDEDNEPARAGEDIMIGDRKIGTMGTTIMGRGIGIARLDKVKNPKGARVAGRQASLVIPPWASYDFALDSQ